MNVITVSREYGAGGDEVARNLAEVLGWELLDRALLHQAAAVEHVPDADLERLDEQPMRLLDHFRLHPPHEHYIRGLTEATRQAAARGNVVLVGRGTRQLVGDLPDAFHLRLVAPREWRAQRLAEREGWSSDAALTRCDAVDRTRARFRQYFFGEVPGPAQYDLTANTGRVPLDDIVTAVTAVVRRGPTAGAPLPLPGRRILTVSRELGAAGTEIIPALGERLGLQVLGRELLEQEAVRLGVRPATLKRIDERPSGIFERCLPPGTGTSYVQALGEQMNERAARGNVLLVGRCGYRVLHDCPAAFHVRLVAPPPFATRRVMAHHWVREVVAQEMIARSDTERRRYAENYFGADWGSPLEYHLTVNGGRQDAAVDLVSRCALSHWQRAEQTK